MKRFRFASALAAVAAGSLAVSACYGSFTLTKKVHEWNGSASSNKFVQWLVFLGLNVVPVYGIAVAVDAIALNSLEFWTGSNPAGGGGDIATEVETIDGNKAIARRGNETFEAVAVSEDKVEIYKDGQRVGIASVTADGKMTVTNEAGDVVLEERVASK